MRFFRAYFIFLSIFGLWILKDPLAVSAQTPDPDDVAAAKKASAALKDSDPALAAKLDKIVSGDDANMGAVYSEAAKALKTKNADLSEKLEAEAGEHAEDEMERSQKD